MFKSLVVYKMSNDFDVSTEELAKALPNFTYSPCGSQDMKKTGWVASLEGSQELLYSSNGHLLLTIMTEEKIIPAAVIKDCLDEKIEKIEEAQGRKLKKTEKDSLKDEVLHELLPRAFSKYNKTLIWIHNASKRIMVEAGSAKKAEDALALLRKTLGSLPVVPFNTETPIELTLTSWIREQSIPDGFTVLDEAELKAILEDGGVITSKKEDLFNDEIKQHIEAGKMVTKLAIDWREKISFVLTSDGLLKRIKMSDAVMEQNSDIDKEDAAQKFDADFVLVTGELIQMLDDIDKVFGAVENNEQSDGDGSENESNSEEE